VGRELSIWWPALDPNERGNSAGFVNAYDVVRRIGHLKIVWIASDHRMHKIDLLQRHLYCRWASDLGRHPHRQKLTTDATGTQTRNVRHERNPFTTGRRSRRF
jgi:hypothetical protein